MPGTQYKTNADSGTAIIEFCLCPALFVAAAFQLRLPRVVKSCVNKQHITVAFAKGLKDINSECHDTAMKSCHQCLSSAYILEYILNILLHIVICIDFNGFFFTTNDFQAYRDVNSSGWLLSWCVDAIQLSTEIAY